ncbi:putative protein phosphatase 2C 12 [Auxenochlorella protothecoides]|uniref:PPM-type phosphatase domain-containing protein n=1 Tax=Auxenochlorella protothecoides TaxID=3075 RepID=A0A087SFG7_AUXPR|nr:putative protein phosphatase 2C 12 [Auxenochlorella protothecoides]KFM24471.1 putative protein phosphatase 2C 12 [Auxenochlorella protothecoides]
MDELDHKVHGSRVFPLIHSMPSLDLSQAGSSLQMGQDAGGEEEVAPARRPADVAIRPAFYWVAGAAGQEANPSQRAAAAAASRWLKADCQDEAVVLDGFAGVPGQALAAACLEVHAGLVQGDAGLDASASGTTACVALLAGRRLLVANVGDSRAVLVRAGAGGGNAPAEALRLTRDAKPDDPEEAARIAAAGGSVRRLTDDPDDVPRVFAADPGSTTPGLAMSRSLGDAAAHTLGVCATPRLTGHVLEERDLALVLASDGVWDVMSDADVAAFVARYRALRLPGVSVGEALTLEALERWKRARREALVDDIAAVVLHLAPPPPPLRAAGPEHSSWAVPRELAAAAASNEEANASYAAWLADPALNPCAHAPRDYFLHLFGTARGSVARHAAAALLGATPFDRGDAGLFDTRSHLRLGVGGERGSSAGLSAEPSPGLNREPSPGLNREPSLGLNREPSLGLGGEREASQATPPSPGGLSSVSNEEVLRPIRRDTHLQHRTPPQAYPSSGDTSLLESRSSARDILQWGSHEGKVRGGLPTSMSGSLSRLGSEGSMAAAAWRASSLDDRHAALESSCSLQPHSGSPLASALAASLASPEPSPVSSEALMPVRPCSRHSGALDIGTRPGLGRGAVAQR